MIHLVISIAMLGLAPLIYFGAARFRKVWKILENLIILVVTALVVLHLLPESIRQAGHSAIFLAFLGLFFPSLLERLWAHGAGKIHAIPVALALGGLSLHGMMDGAALAMPQQPWAGQGGQILQLAVVLHRLPAALFIWGIFYPKRGSYFAAALLALLGSTTLVGFLAADAIIAYARSAATLFFQFQALVAGSLLHIAFDRHDPETPHPHHQHDHAH